MQYEINVEQLDDNGEAADGFAMRLRVNADALARVLPGLLAESMGAESVSVTTNGGPQESSTSSDKPARTRRTKAQIEADKAAEAAKAASGLGEPAAAAGPAPAVAPLASGGVLPGDPAASVLGTVATAAPAAPYDPFAAKS